MSRSGSPTPVRRRLKPNPRCSWQSHSGRVGSGYALCSRSDCITTTTPHAYNPSTSLGQKVTFTYSEPQVIRLMSQIPQRLILGVVERLRLGYTYAQHDRELLERDIDIGQSAKQAFSRGNTGPQRRVARMGTTTKLMRFIFNLYFEVFPKQK